MVTIGNLKQKLLALGVAAPAALLLLGAGTAHADPYPKTFDNGKIRVDYTSSPLGLTAAIQDHSNTGLGAENCNYQTFSLPLARSDVPTPVYSRDVSVTGNGPASLFIPGIQLNTDRSNPNWSVTIWCEHGGILTFNQTY